MAITTTTTINEFDFRDFLRTSDSYKNSFTYEGAEALFNYLEELSDDLGENIEFDPVAWCVEFSEYENYEQFRSDNGYTDATGTHDGYPDIKTLDDLKDNTVVIEFDNGIIVQDF